MSEWGKLDDLLVTDKNSLTNINYLPAFYFVLFNVGSWFCKES